MTESTILFAHICSLPRIVPHGLLPWQAIDQNDVLRCSFLGPEQLLKQLILDDIDIGNRTADLVGYDDRAGLALFEKRDDLVFLVWSSAWHGTNLTELGILCDIMAA